MNIAYRDDAKITIEAAIDLYKRSTLGERRPVDRAAVGGTESKRVLPEAWV